MAEVIAKRQKAQLFLDYLKEQELGESLPLTENNTISFHWANWFRTCNYVKDHMAKSKKSKKRLLNLEEELSEFKKSTIYMKSREKSLKASLFDLYHSYLDNRIRVTWFDRQQETLVSGHNESGPYVTLTSMRWYDKEVFAAFVRKKILTQNIPCRSLRISADIPMNCQYDKSSLTNSDIGLHQLTASGMILKFNGENTLSKLKSCDLFEINLPLEPFVKTSSWDYAKSMNYLSKVDFENYSEELKIRCEISAEVLCKYGNGKNIRSANKNDFFLFIPYADIECINSGESLERIFGSLITKAEDFFTASLKNKAA
ncbi:MAG: hypothetical protein HN509_06010 [Halobacteriovoraceae bacterium]|jgi:hypothetical protein|nr:hypothetical protein [Halobacteriovoraceae bacterium]MBT5095020.1 hypothetical protein [Halobacteriovoraceae bacterium]